MKTKKLPDTAKAVASQTASKKFQHALTFHKKNALDKAEALYLDILKNNLQHTDSLHMLGLIAHQKNQNELALERFSQVVLQSPSSAEPYFNIGIVLQSLGRWEEAISNYEMALHISPKHTSAINNRGNVLLSLGRLDEALTSYEKALELDPKHIEALCNRGHALYLLGHYEAAIISFDKALKIQNNNAKAYHRRGLCLQKLQQNKEALDSFDHALKLNPKDAESLCSSGEVLLTMRQTQEAIDRFCSALTIKPDYASAHMGHGDCLLDLKQADDAMLSYECALRHQPNLAEAHNNRGAALLSLGRLNEALACYEKALSLKEDFSEAHSNLGYALLQLDRIEEAIICFDEALRIQPNLNNASLNRGIALVKIGRYDEAIQNFNQLLSLNNNDAALHAAKGFALQSQGRVGEAIPCLEESLKLDPENPINYCNLGVALMALWRLDAAVRLFEQALERSPHHIEILSNLGQALLRLRKLDRAVATYQRILDLEPDRKFVLGNLLSIRMSMCGWNEFETNLSQVKNQVHAGMPAIYPFPLLALTDNPELHHKCSLTYAATSAYRAGNITDLPVMEEKKDKIRIGYFSADFHNHATAYLIAELIELHDREQFEIYGFSYGPQKNDEMRARLYEGFDEFIDVSQFGDRQIASLSRVLNIDIAVDLKGYTEGSKMGIFIERCAPIQVSYLGFPGTTALPEMDYIIGDNLVTPEGCDADYSEKIIRLPNSYQINDSKRKIADTQFSKKELNLPKDGIVFCCFNNNYKILPETFDSWMRILESVPNSVLWLLSDNIWAEENLQKEAVARGIDASRLIFAKRMPLAEHLARFRHADIFLDTFPYNAHTTASDALWAGVPVLTRSGKSFASRVAASLLTTIGLPDLICQSIEDYEATAINIALNPEHLTEIKNRLQKNRSSSPLFDAARFARNIENSFLYIHKNTRTPS